ncbi:hypothetical protein HELRODRAFT_161781 [Helobdella robusta]|uniref:Uncharacterized protein n=1 Tax=Helobdella robusta TaxID=6412 RepID=T1ERW8_HELRO|nr:hypothetical protein HELRODRAFT_161781 [Helobdella robusta]ESO02504.1 hypothetical protein HELRODRAFT_161781 [Helobdella robusta]
MSAELCDHPEEVHKDIFNESFIMEVTECGKSPRSQKSLTYIFQLLAEVAKADKGRQLCTNEKVLKMIIENLSKKSLDEKENLSFQACRVFGNICFESEPARDIVLKLKGHEEMMKLMKSLCDDIISSLSLSFDITLPSSAYSIVTKHLKVACGAFINLIDEHEELQKLVLTSGIFDIIQKLLIINYGNTDIVKVTLNILEYFPDFFEDRATQSFLSSPKTWEAFYLVLKSSDDQDNVDTLFRILSCYAEHGLVGDSNKELISKSQFPQKLLSLVDDFESTCAVKYIDLVGDFIILLLTGDKSMNILFGNADGEVYKQLRGWMNPQCPVKIQAAAAFAICNFARSDTNCVSLVKSGIVREIKTLLEVYPVGDKQHVLQHALFGTLTNLAISPLNRKSLLSDGVAETCLSFLATESFTVLFKMLATLRMLLSQNEKLACDLGRNEKFLKKIDESIAASSHEGVKCESLRIFASIVKNCRDTDVMRLLLQHHLLQHLLYLLESDHIIMKNEALLSLNVLATALGYSSFLDYNFVTTNARFTGRSFVQHPGTGYHISQIWFLFIAF